MPNAPRIPLDLLESLPIVVEGGRLTAVLAEDIHHLEASAHHQLESMAARLAIPGRPGSHTRFLRLNTRSLARPGFNPKAPGDVDPHRAASSGIVDNEPSSLTEPPVPQPDRAERPRARTRVPRAQRRARLRLGLPRAQRDRLLQGNEAETEDWLRRAQRSGDAEVARRATYYLKYYREIMARRAWKAWLKTPEGQRAMAEIDRQNQESQQRFDRYVDQMPTAWGM